MIEDLSSKSLPEIVSLITSRAISTVDLVETYLNRIEEVNPSVNAVVTIAPDILESARQCDSELARGNIIGPLHGMPLTIKDTIATRGLRTTSGSRLCADDVPHYDAPVVARLKAAGAIILGGGSHLPMLENVAKNMLRIPVKTAFLEYPTQTKQGDVKASKDQRILVAYGVATSIIDSVSAKSSRVSPGETDGFLTTIKNFFKQLMP